MINKAILLEEEMTLPVEYNDKDMTCENAIAEKLGGYINILSKYSVPVDIVENVAAFLVSIKTVFKEYFLGHRNKSYNEFVRAMGKLVGEKGLLRTELPKIPFYRARKNEKNEDYDDYGMFHIPFESRGIVLTQRFSFPGLPCLYLGASSYVCWIELNRPPFDQFQVAMIRQKPSGKQYDVIDLSIHPKKYYEDLKKGATDLPLEEYLLWWPIMASCSIVVKNEDDTFKPEYIFPQFMLQYLLEKLKPEKAIGIKYLSIKAGKITKNQYESDERVYSNYVIPIRTNSNKGFCSFLLDEFKIINNYSGKELMILTDTMRLRGTKTWGKLAGKGELSPETIFGRNNKPVSYEESMFARIEKILNSEDNDQFDENTREMEIRYITDEEIDNLFRVENETLIIGGGKKKTSGNK